MYFTIIKMNFLKGKEEILTQATTWLNSEDIMLSKINQSPKGQTL